VKVGEGAGEHASGKGVLRYTRQAVRRYEMWR
jgi:hypothetical protein